MPVKPVVKQVRKSQVKPHIEQIEQPEPPKPKIVKQPEIETSDPEDNLSEEELASLMQQLQGLAALGGGNSDPDDEPIVPVFKRVAQELHTLNKTMIAINKNLGAIASIMGHNLRRREQTARPAQRTARPDEK